uniref:hypothetical protein n=1 Tax=Nonomuraea sp. CA-251285 TaxID=3240002 RepID=UPI003F496E68
MSGVRRRDAGPLRQAIVAFVVAVVSCWIVLQGLVWCFPQAPLLVLAPGSMVIVAAVCAVLSRAGVGRSD